MLIAKIEPEASWAVTGGTITGTGKLLDGLEALKATGGTITLLTNVRANDATDVVVEISDAFTKPITLVLNGKTLYGVVWAMNNPAQFTIDGSAPSSQIIGIGNAAIISDGNNLKLKGGTYTGGTRPAPASRELPAIMVMLEASNPDDVGKLKNLLADGYKFESEAEFKVITEDGDSAAVTGKTVTVKPSDPIMVESVTLDKTSLTLEVGESARLTATIAPTNATDQSTGWTSDAFDVANVLLAPARVETLKPGTATITVRAMDGSDKKATCVVTVIAATSKPAPGGKLEAPLTQDKVDGVFGPGNATLNPDGSITINNSITPTAPIEIETDVTIDLGGNTITGKPGQPGLVVGDGDKVTIDGGDGATGGDGIQSDGNVTVDGSVSGGSGSSGSGGAGVDTSGGTGDITIGGSGSATGGNSTGGNGNGGDGTNSGGNTTVNGDVAGGSGNGSGSGGNGATDTAGGNGSISVPSGGSSTGGNGGSGGGAGGNGVENDGGGSTTIGGETTGGAGGNGTTTGSGGTTVNTGGAANGGAGGNASSGAGGAGGSGSTSTGGGSIEVGGETTGGAGGSGSTAGGTGGDGASTGGSITVNGGGSSTGGSGGTGSTVAGNGGNGTNTSGTDTTIDGGATGGNGGNGTGNGTGGNGGDGAHQGSGTVDGSGNATGGNGGSGAGTGAGTGTGGSGGSGGAGVGGGASAGGELHVKNGVSTRIDVVGDADVKVELPNAKETVDAVLTQAEKDDPDITDVTVTLKVDDKTADKPADAKKAEDVKPANSVIGAFFDISLQKTITKNNIAGSPETVTNVPNGFVTITIEIPTNMRDGVVDSYVIIRVHNGTAEALSTTQSGNNLTFDTDKFSTYAIAYTKSVTPPTPPTDNTSGGSGSSDDGEYDFWMTVKEKIQNADSGDVIKVNAKGYDKMPWSVMDALRENSGVGLVITWNGKTITIPAGMAQKNESGRIYWPLSKLVEFYADIAEDAVLKLAPENLESGGPGKYIPVTGGGELITLEAPSPIIENTLPNGTESTLPNSMENTQAIAPTQPKAITPPDAGFEQDAFVGTPDNPQQADGFSAKHLAAIAILLSAGAIGSGVWFWKRRKEN